MIPAVEATSAPTLIWLLPTEDDAVLVDDIDLSGGIDVAEDLARPEIAGNPVQRHPTGVALLVEVDRGLASDIEGLPSSGSPAARSGR